MDKVIQKEVKLIEGTRESAKKPQSCKIKPIKLFRDKSEDDSILQAEAVVESKKIVKQFKSQLSSQQWLQTTKFNTVLKHTTPFQAAKSESKFLNTDFQQQLKEEKIEDSINSELSTQSDQLQEMAEVERWSDSSDSFIKKLSYLKKTPEKDATSILSLMKLDKMLLTLDGDSTTSLEESVGSSSDLLVESSNEASYSDKNEAEEELEVEEKAEAESISSSELTEDDDLLICLTEEEDSKAAKYLTDEEDIPEFFSPIESIDVTDDILKAVLLNFIKEFRMKQMLTDTTDILNEIVKSVVDKCEEKRNDPKIFLRQNLHKSLIMHDLMLKLAELEGEQRIRNYLSKRVGNFFSSKGRYRVFVEETPDKIKANTKIYKDTLLKLDMALGREERLNEKSRALIDKIEEKLSTLNDKCMEKLEEFEEIVKNTFTRKGEYANALVLSKLIELRKVRDEVSAVRSELIAKQHTHAILTEKLNKFNYLGNNLRLADYELLSRELENLNSKDMERKSELQKMHLRFNKALNIREHIREEQSLQKHKIISGKLRLKTLQRKKKSLRRHISKLHVERERIRKEISDILMQSETLTNPALLNDYSATLEKIENVKGNVQKLRKEHNAISCKIMEFQGN